MSNKKLFAIVLSLGGLILLTSCQMRIQFGKTSETIMLKSKNFKRLLIVILRQSN